MVKSKWAHDTFMGSLLLYFSYSRDVHSILWKKDQRRKGRETEGAIAQRKSKPPREGDSEYKLIFGIHVDVGR